MSTEVLPLDTNINKLYLFCTIGTIIVLSCSAAVICVPLIQIYFIITIYCFYRLLEIFSEINKGLIMYYRYIGILTVLLACKYAVFIIKINSQEINYEVFDQLIFYNYTKEGSGSTKKKTPIALILFCTSSFIMSCCLLTIQSQSIITDINLTSIICVLLFTFIFVNFCSVHYMNSVYTVAIG